MLNKIKLFINTDKFWWPLIISTNIDIRCDSNNWGCVFMNKIPVGQILCFSLFILTFSIQGILWWNRSFCLFTYEICCFSIFKIISNDNHNSWKFEQTQNCRMGRRQKFLSVQYAFYNFFQLWDNVFNHSNLPCK